MTSFDVRQRGPQAPSPRPAPQPRARLLPSWMVTLPGLPAATLAAAASFAEIEGALLAHLRCAGGPSASYALFLLLSVFPVLWLVQTALVTVPAFLLALATHNRRVVLLAAGILACVVLPAVASTFFEWSGLPVYGGGCP